MWKEYAIEPACLVQSRERFRFLYPLFGTEHGRWIVKIPAKWDNLVREELNTSPLRDVERSRVIEWLKDKGRFLSAGQPNYDPHPDWLANAERHHRLRPFTMILATTNPRNHSDVIRPLDEESAAEIKKLEEGLACPSPISVARTPDAITEAIAPLLYKATTALLFIDPHFDHVPRFITVLTSILERVKEQGIKPERIEYHFSYTALSKRLQENNARHPYFVTMVSQKIEAILPLGFSISLFAWEQRNGGEQLHDRFILAQIGGVNISGGLDSGAPGETTLITRLLKEPHSKVWNDFQRPTAAFDLAPGYPFTISRPAL
jgi:hypothetical protein